MTRACQMKHSLLTGHLVLQICFEVEALVWPEIYFGGDKDGAAMCKLAGFVPRSKFASNLIPLRSKM